MRNPFFKRKWGEWASESASACEREKERKREREREREKKGLCMSSSQDMDIYKQIYKYIYIYIYIYISLCGRGLQNARVWLWSEFLYPVLWSFVQTKKIGYKNNLHSHELWHFGNPSRIGGFLHSEFKGITWRCVHVNLCLGTCHEPCLRGTRYIHATHCNTHMEARRGNDALQHTLQHTATHCNTLQHTATHCNTLQHTATHCNTHIEARCGNDLLQPHLYWVTNHIYESRTTYMQAAGQWLASQKHARNKMRTHIHESSPLPFCHEPYIWVTNYIHGCSGAMPCKTKYARN